MSANAVKLFLVVLILNLGSGLARAQSEDAKTQPEKASVKSTGDKKKTNIDFEDELVEGELKKPELFYLLQKKQFNFKRLIKLRENFLPEMRRDGDVIRSGRSKN